MSSRDELGKKDLLLNGADEVAKRVKQFMSDGGKGKDVNEVLAGGYEGNADLATLMGVWLKGIEKIESKFNKPTTPLNVVIEDGLHRMADACLTPENLAELDKTILTKPELPSWITLLAKDEQWASQLAQSWVSNPGCVALSLFLLQLKKSNFDSPIMSAAFPDVLYSKIRNYIQKPTLTHSELRYYEKYLSDAIIIDYHVALAAALILELAAKDDDPEKRTRALYLLNKIQQVALEELPSAKQVEVLYCCRTRLFKRVVSDSSTLWIQDINKISDDGPQHYKHSIVLQRIVESMLASDKWLELTVQILHSDPSQQQQSRDDITRCKNYIQKIKINYTTHRNEQSATIISEMYSLINSSVCCMMMVIGLFDLVNRNSSNCCLQEGYPEDRSLLVKFVLSVVIKISSRRPAYCRKIQSHLINLLADSQNSLSEDCIHLVTAAFFMVSEVHKTSILVMFESHSSLFPVLERASLHLLVYLLVIYNPNATHAELLPFFVHPAVVEALRTSLPPQQQFIPNGVRKISSQEFLQTVSAIQNSSS